MQPNNNTSRKWQSRAELAEAKSRLQTIISKYAGAHNPCDMGRLYELVFGKAWRNKINDSRKIRHLVTMLRDEGMRICSSTSRSRGGYYLAATAGELDAFLQRSHNRALKILNREAKMRELPLSELLGQMRLNLTGSTDEETVNGTE